MRERPRRAIRSSNGNENIIATSEKWPVGFNGWNRSREIYPGKLSPPPLPPPPPPSPPPPSCPTGRECLELFVTGNRPRVLPHMCSLVFPPDGYHRESARSRRMPYAPASEQVTPHYLPRRATHSLSESSFRAFAPFAGESPSRSRFCAVSFFRVIVRFISPPQSCLSFLLFFFYFF